jgi:hypothetical protein
MIPNAEDRQDLTSHDLGIYLLAFHKADEFRGYVGKTSGTFQERWRRHRRKGISWKMQALMDRRIDFTLLNTQLVPLPYCTSKLVQNQSFFYLEHRNHTDSHHRTQLAYPSDLQTSD